jgi:membrane associated rhomboid family serine protease
MRRSPFEPRLTATVTLLLVNIAVFLAQLALNQFSRFPVEDYFALSLAGLKHGYVWQLLTYQFMHAGPLHLLFNCWAIYVFGQEAELALGRKSFLTLYFASGILGGAVQALAGLALGGQMAAPTVGASAAAFGLVAAYAVLFPDRLILLFFFIPLRAKYLLWLSVVVAAIGIARPGDGIAHAAHLGGLATGFAFVRFAIHWSWRWPRLRRTPAPRHLVRVSSAPSSRWGRTSATASAEDLPAEEFLSREVDPILDKISAHGIQSLTERERRVLEAARHKVKR